MRPPIQSQKHYVQFTVSPITTATTENIRLVDAVESTTANASTEVSEGSIIKAIYIELWLQNDGADSAQIVTVTKDSQNTSGPTYAQMGALFSYNNKKNILFTHQGLGSNDAISGPQVVLRQWIKIPKGKQRFGLNDRIHLSIANVSSQDLNRCGFAIYKEYS